MLDIYIRQTNNKASQFIIIDNLLTNPEVKANYGDLSDHNQIKILNSSKKFSFFFL